MLSYQPKRYAIGTTYYRTFLTLFASCCKYNDGAKFLNFKLRNATSPDAVQAPRLIPKTVNAILRMNEATVDQNIGSVKSYSKNYLQANKPFEDRNVQGRLLHTGAFMYSVFDGHGGSACVQSVTQRIFDYIAVALADSDVLEKIVSGRISPIADLVEYSSDFVRGSNMDTLHRDCLVRFADESIKVGIDEISIKDGLINALCCLDRDIVNWALPCKFDQNRYMSYYEEIMSTAFSGAVGCVAYVDGSDLFVANTGDARAILGVHNDNRWQALPVSNLHSSDNMKEVERLKSCHPNELPDMIRNYRLFGELIPFRAFGDVRYKWTVSDLKHIFNKKKLQPNLPIMAFEDAFPNKYRTPPYLTAEPEVIHHQLTPKDKFLVLATDGLWEVLSPEKVVQLVAGHMDGQQVLVNYKPAIASSLGQINGNLSHRKTGLQNRTLDCNVATHLLRCCLGPDHGEVSAQLTLPQSIVRYYRDDITIVVVFFNSEHLKDKAALISL